MNYEDYDYTHTLSAQEITVIMTVNTMGGGTKASPVRDVVNLFTKSGKHICTIDPATIKDATINNICSDARDFI